MTTPARAPLWLPPISFVAMGVIVWLISFTPKWLSPYPVEPFRVTGQAILLVILLRAFCYWPPMIRWITSMPVVHRVIFGLLIGSMILGHYTLNGRAYYPYVAWEIFGFDREDDPVACRELIATTAGGKQVRLLAEQLFPSIVQFNLPLDAKGNPLATMEPLVHAMAKVYNDRHADDPVRRVDLMAMTVKLHPSASESRHQPSCELLKHYEISSDPWN